MYRLLILSNSSLDSGSIEFPEFITLMAKNKSDSVEDMRRAFEEFDENGDGLISRDELRKFISGTGEAMSQNEFEEIMDDIDTDGDGYINYEGN